MTSIFPGGNALRATNITNEQQNESATLMEKISKGKRLTTGADDAGNIHKVNNLKAKVLSTKAAIQSVTDMMSMAQLADQGYNNINKMLLRANELALQSTNKIYKDADRIAYNNEIQNIINEVDNIADGIGFNNTKLINSSIKQIDSDIGTGRTGEISLGLSNINTKNVGLYSQSSLNFSSDLRIDTFDGTNKDNFIYKDVSTNSSRLIDLGDSLVPSYGKAFFSGSHIDLSLNEAELNNETTKLRTVATASTGKDIVSIVGGKVYVGNGTTADHIGTIDGTLDGMSGKKLRINIEEPSFTNGDFESATDLEGWTVVPERVYLNGSDLIDGKTTPVDTTYHIDNSSRGLNDGNALSNIGNMSGGITTTQVKNGSKAVRLESSGLQSSTGFATVRGPYLYSNSYVTLGTASSVSFEWRAEGGGDAYDVYAYLVDIDDPSKKITLLNEHTDDDTGTSPWTKKTVNINQEGTYQFVFVGGSFDATGGRALGARLFIDDVSVTNAARKLSGSVIESISSLLYGEVDATSSDNLSVGTSSSLIEPIISSGQDVSIFGALGKNEINVKSGDIAEVISNKINAVAGDTGVEAISSTQAMLSFENTSKTNLNDTVSFNLYGIDGTMKNISTKVNFGSGNQNMDLDPLKTEINNFSSQTGITAYISDDKQAITLKTRQGFDILIEDFNLKNDTNTVFMYLNEMKSSGQVSPCSLKLSQSSSGASANDSARIFGEVILKSHKHFSVNSSQADSILSLREKNLDFVSLSTIAARSFETAKSSVDVIKFSMKSLAAEQNKVGGLANQLQETVRNLSHIRSLDQIAIGKIEDVDIAKTVVSLKKSNYIQQIATAMVNRVKSTMEAVLQMLER